MPTCLATAEAIAGRREEHRSTSGLGPGKDENGLLISRWRIDAQYRWPTICNWRILEALHAPSPPRLHGSQTCRAAAVGPEWPLIPYLDVYGEPMPKHNYHQARKQKEVARKARQQEKQQRRSARLNAGEADTGAPTSQESAGPGETSPESAT